MVCSADVEDDVDYGAEEKSEDEKEKEEEDSTEEDEEEKEDDYNPLVKEEDDYYPFVKEEVDYNPLVKEEEDHNPLVKEEEDYNPLVKEEESGEEEKSSLGGANLGKRKIELVSSEEPAKKKKKKKPKVEKCLVRNIYKIFFCTGLDPDLIGSLGSVQPGQNALAHPLPLPPLKKNKISWYLEELWGGMEASYGA